MRLPRVIVEFDAQWLEPLLPLRRWKRSIMSFPRYLRDWREFTGISTTPLYIKDSYPCLLDKTNQTPFDTHYFYQGVWASQLIAHNFPVYHVDIGSEVQFVSIIAAFVPVFFVDLRPLLANVPNLRCLSSNILQLPFPSNSINSLSCLHVVEHIGLGRYGDPIDPQGTAKAAMELTRVLEPEGNLYLSLPIGKPRICFNAHRIHSPKRIIELFNGLELVELSVTDDNGSFLSNVQLNESWNAEYACGMFHFRKPRS